MIPSPVVETRYGKVQGFTVATDGGFETDVFLGIPFAKPPVGELRFEKPQPPEPWTETRQATELADACATPEMRISCFGGGFSEDCLYLNVYAPHKKTGPCPVMVLIHGGGFISGSARMYRDYKDITESFVSKGIVVVIIQYRLSVYGFGSTGDSELPGNLGLWDQAAALRFVHENIAGFGGDPKRVTLYGCSSGSASVSVLAASPHTRDLFSQAIQMSGSMLSPWALHETSVHVTKEILKRLGAPVLSGKEAKEFLKKASEEDIEAALKKIPMTDPMSVARFGPRIDGDFFPKPLEELTKESPKKSTLQGMVEEESMHMTVMHFGGADTAAAATDKDKLAAADFVKDIERCLEEDSIATSLLVPKEKLASYSAQDFEKAVRQLVATKEAFGEHADEVAARIIDFYLEENAPKSKDNVFYLRKYTQLCSDLQFNVPILREARLKAGKEWPMFLYNTLHMHKTQFASSPFDAAAHGQDHGFIFRGENAFLPMQLTEEDKKVADFLIDLIAAFVKSGNPSTPNLSWPATTTENLEYVAIKPEPEAREHFFADRLQFWNGITEKYERNH